MSRGSLLSPHSQGESFVHRAPTAAKLGACLALILGVGALPARLALWGLCALPPLLLGARFAGVSLRALLRRLALALPVLLGISALGLFQISSRAGFAHDARLGCAGLLAKSVVSLLAVQLLVSSTPFSDLLRTLRRAHVPEILCSTIALLHRYSYLIADESRRMRRARAGRTLRGGRLALWLSLGNGVGLLFVRSVTRAERVQAAMRARGGS